MTTNSITSSQREQVVRFMEDGLDAPRPRLSAAAHLVHGDYRARTLSFGVPWTADQRQIRVGERGHKTLHRVFGRNGKIVRALARPVRQERTRKSPGERGLPHALGTGDDPSMMQASRTRGGGESLRRDPMTEQFEALARMRQGADAVAFGDGLGVDVSRARRHQPRLRREFSALSTAA